MSARVRHLLKSTLQRAVGWQRTLATLELAHPRPEGCDHSQPAGKHAPLGRASAAPNWGICGPAVSGEQPASGRLLALCFSGTTVQRDWHGADAEPWLG